VIKRSLLAFLLFVSSSASAQGLLRGQRLRLDPQGSNPFTGAQTGIWVDSSSGDLKFTRGDGTVTTPGSSGSGGSAPSGVPVLYCHGVADHVTHGVYWHPASAGLALPMAFRVEGWAMGDPWQGSQYLVADGYGGGHVFLFGLNGNLMFNQGTAGELQISYSADDSPPQTWGVLDLRIQNDEYSKPSIVQRINGIPVSRTFIPAGKTRTIAGSASGTWWTCGSDHSNFKGWVAQLREWDTVAATDIYPGQAYAPLRILNGEGPAEEPVDFLTSYIQPTLGTVRRPLEWLRQQRVPGAAAHAPRLCLLRPRLRLVLQHRARRPGRLLPEVKLRRQRPVRPQLQRGRRDATDGLAARLCAEDSTGRIQALTTRSRVPIKSSRTVRRA
jgi:hypothetical protein